MRLRDELEARWQSLSSRPRTLGRVVHINARLPEHGHRALKEARVMCETGLLSDEWNRQPEPVRLASRQVTLMELSVARLIADGQPIETAGDNFYVDFDLSVEHIPTGSLLRVGSVILQVSADVHRGCEKFSKRFGQDALMWVNEKKHRARRLRGTLCKVVGPGLVCLGDSVQHIRGNELRYPNGKVWIAVSGERVVAHGENGLREAEGYVVKGCQHGLWRYYRSTGTLHMEGQYRAGLREGRWLGHWASGERAWLMRYEAGCRVSGEFYTPMEPRDRLLAEALTMETFAFDSFEPADPVIGPTILVARATYNQTTGHIASLELVNTAGIVTHTRTWRDDGEEICTSPQTRSDGAWTVRTEFHATGFRACEERRRDGILDGDSSYWDDEGIIERLCVYEEGELKVTRHYTDGVLSSMSLHLPDGSVRVSEMRRAA